MTVAVIEEKYKEAQLAEQRSSLNYSKENWGEDRKKWQSTSSHSMPAVAISDESQLIRPYTTAMRKLAWPLIGASNKAY